MNELKCPNCGTVFQIDEVDYMSIVKQVKDKEFEKNAKESLMAEYVLVNKNPFKEIKFKLEI